MRERRQLAPLLLAFGILLAIEGPARAGFPGTDAYIPAVARAQGDQNANFLSTLWITNLTDSIAQVEVRFHETGISNTSPLRFYDTLGPNETKKYDNVVETRFARTGTSGALRILSDREVYSSSRTYDLTEGGSVRDSKGLFFAAVPASFAIVSGEEATLQGVSQGGPEDMRYNFGLLETTGQAVTVEVGLLDGSGVQTAAKRYTLPAYGRVQYGVSDIHSAVSTANASLVARVVSGTGRVLFYGTQIANGSNDSSGFEMSFRSSLVGGAGVASLNGLTGVIAIQAGNSNTSVTTSGSSVIVAGVKGDIGLTGPKGTQGPKGDTGPQGPAGPSGLFTASIRNGTEILNQRPNWISGMNKQQAGVYTLNLVAGVFNGLPNCTCMGAGFPATQCAGTASSPSSFAVKLLNGTGANHVDDTFTIMCVNP